MKKTTQDRLWAVLPKEERKVFRKTYTEIPAESDYSMGYDRAMEYLFGEHNLTSYEEPSELLFVERGKVIELHTAMNKAFPREAAYSVQEALKSLFGDKCLPDKEPSVQVEPRFRKGKRVKIADERVKTFGNIATISHCEVDDGKILYWLDDDIGCYMESQLEPYTEEKPTPKYKVGDKVRIPKYNEIGTISKVHQYDDRVEFFYEINLYGVGFFLANESELEPYAEPKYNVGDKVVVAHFNKIGIVSKIKSHPHIGFNYEVETGKDAYLIVHENDLQPYTEPETNNDMEEKELNLAELLKGCEGEEIYSPTFGVVKVTMANCNCIGVDPWNHNSKSFRPDGRYVDKADAVVSLFPSRALYEKYPLDARKAWQIWAEERKPKRWRAKANQSYWRIKGNGEISCETENRIFFDDQHYNCMNYFRTEEEAKQAAEAVRKTLEDFHANNTEK